MAFVLSPDHDPGAQVLRLLRAQHDTALRLLQTPQAADAGAWHVTVHDARRALRRMRALLRLLPADEASNTLRAQLRAAGQALSSLRDAHALLETLDALHRHDPQLLGSAHADLLLRLKRGVRHDERAHAAGLRQSLQILRGVAARLDTWPVQLDLPQLWPALRRGAARAQRAARAARAEPNDRNLHRWRRRMREHALQLELVSHCWPAVLAAQVAEHKRLARMLGQLRDLSMLRVRLRRLRSAKFGRLGRDTLLHRLRGAQARLLDEAMTLGALVHAEPPRRLIARIAAYHAQTPQAGPRD